MKPHSLLLALLIVAVLIYGVAGQSRAATQEPSRPQATAATRFPRVHDPVIAKEGDTYYAFSTGRGLLLHTSKDLATWDRRGGVFEKPMPWTAEKVPGSTDHYWAPDISRFNGKWHLYYSVSTFGKNRSAIGLATNTTLDPLHPDYRWKDEGVVVESQPSDDYNAIDPNILVDGDEVWLSFGSFWGGIMLHPLDPKTGKSPVGASAAIQPIARRPRGGETRGAVEAPFIIRRGGFYYLFVSFDFCCRGVNSNYNIRVGRAKRITGPYADRDGKPMLEGGGTLLLAGAGRWKGPGHNAVIRDKDGYWLVFHAYDAEQNGTPTLRIERLTWDAEGWPSVQSKGEDS